MSLETYPPPIRDASHAKPASMSQPTMSSSPVPSAEISSSGNLKPSTTPVPSQPANMHQHPSASRPYTSPQAATRESYEGEPLLDDMYTMDVAVVAPSPKRVSTAPATNPPALASVDGCTGAPALPERSALRASRLLDNMGLKLGGSMENADLGQATPLDMYMSSEEDASSSADDLSDDDLDLSSEGSGPASSSSGVSPMRRGSHEDTARVVSVVFSGKPSIVNLSSAARRASLSAASQSRISRARTPVLSAIRTHDLPADRCESPASSVSSFHNRTLGPPGRSSTTISDLVTSQRPPLFLSIDPYANGSGYSLEPQSASAAVAAVAVEDSPMKMPRTPTQQLMKGMSRTIGLVRKKSRPFLSGSSREGSASATTPSIRYSSLGASSRLSLAIPIGNDEPPIISEPAKLSRRATSSIMEPASYHDLADPFLKPQTTPESRQKQSRPSSAMSHTPVTYDDMIRSARKTAKLTISPLPLPVPHNQLSSDLLSPAPSPTCADGGHKRGILRGFNARRRSIKLTGKLNR